MVKIQTKKFWPSACIFTPMGVPKNALNVLDQKKLRMGANRGQQFLGVHEMKALLKFFVLVAVCWSLMASSITNGETIVTTYITKVQEERHDTRWTLTEWLRIKERMRLMDVWLAMFSEPKNAAFRPELSLAAYRNQTVFTHLPQHAYQGSVMRGQLWLTNLVSSSVGVRTLNIDFGGEIQREENTYKGSLLSGVDQQALVTAAAAQGSDVPDLNEQPAGRGSSRLQSYLGTLRLFGKHVQDSSLVFKYGEYRYQGFDPTARLGVESIVQKGPQWGAELTLYFSNWMGVEGNYSVLGQEPSRSQIGPMGGDSVEALLFIEVSVLRIVGGSSIRSWSQQKADGLETTKQSGVLGGLKFNL